MGGDDRPNSVYITLTELYNLLRDTRERLAGIAQDVQWVKEESDGFDDDVKNLWVAIADIRNQIGKINSEQSSLRSILTTAASIVALLLSLGVTVYVACAGR